MSKRELRHDHRCILRRIAANAPANPRPAKVESHAAAPAAMAPVLTSEIVAGSGVVLIEEEQLPVSTVLVSMVTAAPNAMALPQSMVVPVFKVTLASAMILP